MPYPPPQGAPTLGKLASGWFLIAFVVLTALVLNSDADGSAAYRTGRMLTLALVSAGLAALLARFVPRLRRWRAFGLVVAGIAGLSYLSTVVVPGLQEQEFAAQQVGRAQAPEDPSIDSDDLTLRTPPVIGGFRRLDTPAAQRRGEVELARFESAPGGIGATLNPVYAEYVVDGGLVFFRGFNATGEMREELRDSPEQTLTDLLAGMGVREPGQIDPGKFGGVAACTDAAGQVAKGLIFCAWADQATVGLVSSHVAGLDIAGAAELTRKLRAGVTQY